jgi:hypothetical protein
MGKKAIESKVAQWTKRTLFSFFSPEKYYAGIKLPDGMLDILMNGEEETATVL